MNGTLNKVMLIGHLGDDVKIHYFDGGGCVGRFPLATNEVYTNKTSGEKVTNTDWHNIVLRNKAAEICEKYLSKGDKIYIEGRLKTRKWDKTSHLFKKISQRNNTGARRSGTRLLSIRISRNYELSLQ